jgi:PAS domain S-box-containing protein
VTGTDGAEEWGSGGSGQKQRDGVKDRGRGLLVPALVFLVLAVAVAVAGWAIFARQAADMRDESASSLQAVHKLQSSQISLWFQDELGDARLLAAAPGLVESLQRLMDEPAGSPPSARLRAEIEFYRRGHGVAAVSVFDDRRQPVLTAHGGPGAKHAHTPTPRTMEVAAEALRRGGVVFSGAYLEADGSVVMDFAAPLRDATLPLRGAGAIVVHLDAADTLFPMLESWPASMQTGESVVAALVGDRIVSVNPLPVGGREALTVSRPAADSELPAAMAVRGRTGILEGVDYRGEPVLAAVGRIPKTPWYLVTKQDLAVIDEPIVERGWATLAWVAGLILLAGVVLLLYWRVRESSTLRRLVELESDRSRARTHYAALMREAKEIVVVHRPDATIVEANDWALQTYGYSREEFIGRSTVIFLASDDLVSSEEATRRLEEEGGHRTFEGVHRRRDGVEFPVEVGQSIIEVDDEKLVLEVIRDVGERKAAEVALRDSEARYRTLFENALSGFSLQEVVLDEDGEPVDFVALAVNPAFEVQTGLRADDVVGRPISQALPGILETDIVQRGGRVALTGVAERSETYFPALGRYLDIQLASPQKGQFAAIVLDVTDRHEAEETLAGFFAGSLMGLFILDDELRYVRVNETLARWNHRSVEEHLGRSAEEVLAGFGEPVLEALRAVVDTGQAVHGFELSAALPDRPGEARHVLVSMFPIADPDDEVRFVGGAVLDITAAKRAERDLEENRAFLERVLGVSPDVIYIFDIAEQRNVFSNRGMEDLLGYSPEEVREMGTEVLPRLLHPDDVALMAAHHRRALELPDGEVLEVEYRMRHAGGQWRVLHGRDAVFARDAAGVVTQLIGTAHDVTVQRAAEAGLQQITQRLEATVLASPLAIVAVDGEREVVLWNPAAAAIFGWSAPEVLGRPLSIIPPDLEAQAEALLRRLRAGEQFAGLDLPSVRKDGERIHTSVSLALMRGAEGEPDSVLMIFEDVTERRANVVRLARLTRLYQVLSAVTEAIPEERDPDRLFERVCGIVVAQGGFRRAWVGRKRRNGLVQVIAAVGAEDAPGTDGEEARALADGLGYVGVALAQGRSDTVQDVAADPRTAGVAAEAAALGIRSAAAVPVFIDGRHDTVLAIHSSEPGRFDAEELALLERLAADVGFAVQAGGEEAARRKAERRLEALNRSLERRVRERTDALEGANAELEAFSYSVSHDLRAPLRALDGFSLALLEDYGDRLDGDATDYLERIRAASQRMARLIDDLLMLSRVTRRDMTLGDVDLTALARTIGAELAADEPERKVTFAVAENMWVGGDAQLLDAAMRNLLGNAWKFTSRVRDARVTVGVEDREGGRVYFVRDNGAGFDAAYADKLFAPFQRLHGEDEFPGTGIGLATVQRIVRRHGGSVWAEGATGRGATVWFTLGPRGEGA